MCWPCAASRTSSSVALLTDVIREDPQVIDAAAARDLAQGLAIGRFLCAALGKRLSKATFGDLLTKKFSVDDLKERSYWKQYMKAYEECLSATSTRDAPWYVVPADDLAEEHRLPMIYVTGTRSQIAAISRLPAIRAARARCAGALC